MGEILFLIILGVLSFVYNNFIVKDRDQAQNEQDLSDWLPTPEPEPAPKSTPPTQATHPPLLKPISSYTKEVQKEPELEGYKDAYSIKDKVKVRVRVSKNDFQKRNKLKKALIMNTILAKPKAFDRP